MNHRLPRLKTYCAFEIHEMSNLKKDRMDIAFRCIVVLSEDGKDVYNRIIEKPVNVYFEGRPSNIYFCFISLYHIFELVESQGRTRRDWNDGLKSNYFKEG